MFLFETKPGKPDQKSGVHPTLIKVTINDVLSPVMSVSCVLEKPVSLNMSEERYRQGLKLLEEMQPFLVKTKPADAVEADNYASGFFLKEINVKTSQVMLKYDFKEKALPYIFKTNLGDSKLKIHFDQLSNIFSADINLILQRFSIVLVLNNINNILLDPANIEMTAVKQFLSPVLSRNLNIKLKMSHCNLHVGPNHLHCLEVFKKNILQILERDNFIEHPEVNEEAERQDNILTDSEVDELYYQDDLRAGAFQFVDAGDNNPEPSAYQAVFGRNTLTWKYPQRRTLTKAVIFPLPFMEASDVSAELEDGVDCELLHWSETLQHFVVYQSFQLSESKVNL